MPSTNSVGLSIFTLSSPNTKVKFVPDPKVAPKDWDVNINASPTIYPLPWLVTTILLIDWVVAKLNVNSAPLPIPVVLDCVTPVAVNEEPVALNVFNISKLPVPNTNLSDFGDVGFE